MELVTDYVLWLFPGCVGQCGHMSLCQNAGICKEYYATYMCDCAKSAFNGCYCGNGKQIYGNTSVC